MQWVVASAWGVAVCLCAGVPRRARRLRVAFALALALSMVTQLVLLRLDGLLTLETGLPLHLCGLFGILSIPMLWRAPNALYELSAFLAAPAAALTLLFPAVIQSSHPRLMQLAFYQLHVLVALTPVFLHKAGRPLPQNPRRALVLGNGYLLAVAAFNRAAHTNYLFLRAAPVGTPLAFLLARGGAFYVCALEMLCMLLFIWLARAYGQLATAKSS